MRERKKERESSSLVEVVRERERERENSSMFWSLEKVVGKKRKEGQKKRGRVHVREGEKRGKKNYIDEKNKEIREK